ncbi:MAG: hypothetical protein IT364_16490, partial [Candidatus Hydrogenedentes bacterium]|nr:hypothetical protein [Candidatus Hydrogenedentota bacterium]
MNPIYILAASDGTPLTKTYRLVDGRLEKSPYPHVFAFSSFEETPMDLRHLARILEKHSTRGKCLLKGKLNRPLHNESRAGSTITDAPTDWICLDIDYMPGITSAEDFLKMLPDYMHDVSYVVQLSASSGIDKDRGFSAHIFMELSEPVPAPQLKVWLKSLNLNTRLRDYLRLNRAGTALRWPMDISTCQNDKLIYIAPPDVSPNLKRKLPDKRIFYVRHAKAVLDVTP